MTDDIARAIEQERCTLLLLARDQSTREQIEAAGRHVQRLGRLLKERDAAVDAPQRPAAAMKIA